MERRELLRGLATGAMLVSSQAVSACSLAEYDDDTWGQKLIDYLRDGNARRLDDLFKDNAALFAFESWLVGGGDELYSVGAIPVKNALIAFRRQQTSNGFGDTSRLLQSANIVGSQQQGRMSKIELCFAENSVVDTSCGPTRSEQHVDLYFQAGVYETGNDWVKWSIERIALMPRLETKRYGVERT